MRLTAVTAALAVAIAALGWLTPAAATAQDAGAAPLVYQPPVDGPVVDPFRPPPGPYGAGNRGVDFATVPGSPVRAAAPGVVAFAGAVAGDLHVTIDHPDGLRTTYAFLATVMVAPGDAVETGTAVGSAGSTVHFSVRHGDEYLDPASVLTLPGGGRVHLVPDESRPAAEASGHRAVPSGLLAWVAEPSAGESGQCTSPTVVPPAPVGRRVVVLVGGLGSSSAAAAVADVDTVALGYASGDVVRFSYLGGRVPSSGPMSADLAGIDARGYDAIDTVGDLRAAGSRLADLLVAVVRASPDATVDVVAHSQGGVVTRAALVALAGDDRTLGAIGVVATLGSPHRGADLATAARLVRATAAGDELLTAVGTAATLPMGAGDLAIAQLAPGSDLLTELDRAPVPAGVRMVSIGARGDLVVPAHRTRLAGARNVVISVSGAAGDHATLPGAPAATRELALALAGLPPSCEGRVDRFADAVSGPLIGLVELAVGAAVALTATGISPTRAPG